MRIFAILLILSFLSSGIVAQDEVTPEVLTTLSATINESSGLVNLDGEIWTHNDSGGLPALYQVNVQDGTIIRTVVVQNATNVDWEDLAMDSSYIYIGDVGNNSGSRTDLKIYRVSRADLAANNTVTAEIINYSYSDQTSWVPQPNQTDFDCEAFIHYQDNLYLFSKDWLDQKTRMYELSDDPGTHVAQYLETFDVNGLITGAEILYPANMLALTGYSSFLMPFTWLFDDFSGTNFFNGTSQRLNWTFLAQAEGVCTADTAGLYFSSEKAGFPFNQNPKLFYLDISDYIVLSIKSVKERSVAITADRSGLYIKSNNDDTLNGEVTITNISGQIIMKNVRIQGRSCRIPVNWKSGTYIVTIVSPGGQFSKKVLVG